MDAREALRGKMKTKGWTLRQAAAKATPRVSHAALGYFLLGRRAGWKVALAVASLTGCSAKDIVGRASKKRAA